jgi:hypothetical protein
MIFSFSEMDGFYDEFQAICLFYGLILIMWNYFNDNARIKERKLLRVKIFPPLYKQQINNKYIIHLFLMMQIF